MNALLPFLGFQRMVHGLSDQVITAIVLSISLPVIIPGVMKHRDERVLVMFSVAICLMFFTNLLGEHVDFVLHMTLTALASILLLRATWLNKRLLACRCSAHAHEGGQIPSHDHGRVHVEKPQR